MAVTMLKIERFGLFSDSYSFIFNDWIKSDEFKVYRCKYQ
jgi:hypothetical protein